MPLPLPELFPDEDYRFHLTLRKGDLRGFFASPASPVLAERARWLQDDAGRYAAMTEGAGPLLDEFAIMAAGWTGRRDRPAGGDGPDHLRELGRELEPDFLLLSRDETGIFRLRAGVVCFPSSWALAEKMGRTIDEIHGVVPGLNPALGPTIGQFLGRLKPGAPYERANWGLAATPELNMHPALGRPRLGRPLDTRKVWVRIEDQILAAMPATGGILFGIRLRLVALADLLQDPPLRKGFHRAVVTMQDALAAYKAFAPVRRELIDVSA